MPGVEITIGIQHVARELTIETKQTSAQVEAAVAAAVEKGSGVLSLTDEDGRITLVPTSTIAYVQIGDSNHHFVGFSA
jgi:hypothetical protein